MALAGPLSGPGSLTKVGSGTLILAANNSYSGSTEVNGGILSLAGSLNSVSALIVGGGTFSYAPAGNAGAGNTQSVAGLTVNPGVSAIEVSTGNALALGPIARNAGGAVNFTTTGTITTTQTNSNGILGPWATFGSGASMTYAAVSGGSAPYTIGPYTAATPVTAGVTGLSDSTGTVNYSLSGGGGSLTAAVSANTIQFTGAANTITVSGASALSLNGVMNAGSGLATIADGSLIIGAGRELVFTGQGNMAVAAAVQDNGSGASAVTMAGGGTLVLSGTNTYSGSTLVSSGTLVLANSGALQQSTLPYRRSAAWPLRRRAEERGCAFFRFAGEGGRPRRQRYRRRSSERMPDSDRPNVVIALPASIDETLALIAAPTMSQSVRWRPLCS